MPLTDENVRLALLYDLYGGLLTQKQRDIFELYRSEDLSLGEIAQHLGISRQGVRDALVHAEDSLRSYEEVLGMLAQQQERESLLAEAAETVRRLEVYVSGIQGHSELKKLDSLLEALAGQE